MYVFQFLFETAAECGHCTIGRPHCIERIHQQGLLLIPMLTGTIGTDQRKRLPSLQSMFRYRFAHRLLGLIVKGAKRMRQCHAHIPFIYEADHRFAQPLSQQ